LVLLLILNAINFGYYFVVCVHLASAPRQGVEYSILGYQTPAALSLAAAGPITTNTSVSYLALQDMKTLAASSNAAIQVCSQVIGIQNAGLATQKASCTNYGSAPSPDFSAVPSDPESPNFVLHRVYVQYKVKPLIDAGPFGLITPNLTFNRQVSMRAIN